MSKEYLPWLVIAVLVVGFIGLGAMLYQQSVQLAEVSGDASVSAMASQRSAVPEAARPPAATSQVEYDFYCYGGKQLQPSVAAVLDSLLKSGGWQPTSVDGVHTCLPTGSIGGGDRAVVITSDCAYGDDEMRSCSRAVLLLADLSAKTLKTVVTEDTSEMYGQSILELRAWSPDALKYRVEGTLPEGDCSEAVLKDVPAYSDKTTKTIDGATVTDWVCHLVSCDNLALMSCEGGN
jgi:hypothetical protein